MKDLRELEKRLETATESSWELDRDIGLLIGGWSYEPDDSEIVRKYPMRRWLRDRDGNVFSDHPGSVSGEAFTDSLDAAVALVERVLPRAGMFIARGRLRPEDPLYGARLYESDLSDASDEPVAEAEHEVSLTFALLLALIRALIAKGDRHD